MLARLRSRSNKAKRQKKQAAESESGSLLLLECSGSVLRSASDFRGFGIDTPAVESVIDDLSYSGNVGVNVHPITCSEMTNNSFGCNVQNSAAEL